MTQYSIEEAVNKIKKIDDNAQKISKSLVRDFESRGSTWISKPVTKAYNIKAKEFKGYLSKTNPQSVNVGGYTVEAKAFKVQGARLSPSAQRFSMTPKQPKTASTTRKRKSTKQPYEVKTGNYKLFVTILKGQKKQIGEYSNRRKTASHSRSPTMIMNGIGGHPAYRDNGVVNKFMTLSPAQMVENKEVNEQIQENIRENMEKRYEHYKKRFLE